MFWILGISICGFVIAYVIYTLLNKRNHIQTEGVLGGSLESPKRLRQRWNVLLQASYLVVMIVPPLRSYTLRVRKRLAGIHIYSEYQLRLHTMKIVITIVAMFLISITILMTLNPSWIFLLSLILTAIVLNGLYIDMFIGNLEKRLLQQMLHLFAEVRHAFHRHGMVEEAVNEAAERSEEEISRHGYAIYEVLLSSKPQEELEQYYETAPNRFLKAFAGISHLVMEYGDQVRADGSLYLRGLSNLSKEIQLDILRRNKLDYLLKGLHVIALAPLFFTRPIELWARNHFPLMDTFYMSKAGIVTKIAIFIIIIMSYILLQKLKSEEETAYRASDERRMWEQRLYNVKWIKIVVYALLPPRQSTLYLYLSQLIKDCNQKMQVEWLYVRRIVLFVGCILIGLCSCLMMHRLTKERIGSEAPSGTIFFGKMSNEEVTKIQQVASQDREVMKQLGMNSDSDYNAVARQWIGLDSSMNKDQLRAATVRVMDKLDRWNSEYLKWWEVLLSICAGFLGYMSPLWLLQFQKKVRFTDMKHEVYQFQTMIAILREMERISVEQILEWIASYAVIFRTPLHRCVLHFEHGAELALTELKQEVRLDEFQRLVDKLLLAVEKIPVSQAFDDLESEMAYYFEQRRLDYERTLDMKANLGRMIGFAPMYSLIFMYLVAPLIWMSFTQMNLYYDQIQKL